MQKLAQQAGGREESYEEGIQDGFGKPRKELADLSTASRVTGRVDNARRCLFQRLPPVSQLQCDLLHVGCGFGGIGNLPVIFWLRPAEFAAAGTGL